MQKTVTAESLEIGDTITLFETEMVVDYISPSQAIGHVNITVTYGNESVILNVPRAKWVKVAR